MTSFILLGAFHFVGPASTSHATTLVADARITNVGSDSGLAASLLMHSLMYEISIADFTVPRYVRQLQPYELPSLPPTAALVRHLLNHANDRRP